MDPTHRFSSQDGQRRAKEPSGREARASDGPYHGLLNDAPSTFRPTLFGDLSDPYTQPDLLDDHSRRPNLFDQDAGVTMDGTTNQGGLGPPFAFDDSLTLAEPSEDDIELDPEAFHFYSKIALRIQSFLPVPTRDAHPTVTNNTWDEGSTLPHSGPRVFGASVVEGAVTYYTNDDLAQDKAASALLTDEERQQGLVLANAKLLFSRIKRNHYPHLIFDCSVPYPSDEPMTEDEIFDYLGSFNTDRFGSTSGEPSSATRPQLFTEDSLFSDTMEFSMEEDD